MTPTRASEITHSLSTLPLLAVPNISEGRDPASIEAIARAFTAGGRARLLDLHSDPDHHRSVLTLAGDPGSLADALLAGAGEGIRRIDIGERTGESGEASHRESPRARGGGAKGSISKGQVSKGQVSKGSVSEGQVSRGQVAKVWPGQHPHVGAVDVVPVVYLDATMRGAACAEALVVGDRIGEELGVPVFLYGELAGGRPRAALRRGGALGLARRMLRGDLAPDFGPPMPHPTGWVTLVAARGPLVAFNLELAAPATVEDARAIASLIREGGVEGLEGVRAIGVALRRGRRVTGQVSMNVERPTEMPLGAVVEAVRRHAEVACGELVGLAPQAALEGFPRDVPMPDFDPGRQVIEKALGL